MFKKYISKLKKALLKRNFQIAIIVITVLLMIVIDICKHFTLQKLTLIFMIDFIALNMMAFPSFEHHEDDENNTGTEEDSNLGI